MDDPIRVLILDDERPIRNLVRKCIDWASLGMEIVGEAESAGEALELVETLAPHIVLTDIHMPFMDGIAFARLVAERHPDVRIVILTGHDEFEYAQRGIQIGVADFLLKPIDDAELRASMVRVRDRILDAEAQRRDVREIRRQLEESRPLLVERFLQSLVEGALDADAIGPKLAYYGIAWSGGPYQVAVLEASPLEGDADPAEEARLILGAQVMDQVRAGLEGTRILAFFDAGRRVALLSTDDASSLADRCERIRAQAAERLRCHLSVGIGNPCPTADKIRFSYRESLEALEYRVVVGPDQVVAFPEVAPVGVERTEVDRERLARLHFHLKAGDSARAAECIDGILPASVAPGPDGLAELHVVASCVLSSVLHLALNAGLPTERLASSETAPFADLSAIGSLPGIRSYLHAFAARIADEIAKGKTSRNRRTVDAVLGYIDANLADPALGLASIARAFFLNPSYLSRMVRAETGRTLTQHVLERRMARAMALLDTTELLMYQIAEQVGFSDPNYFSTCFRKHAGMAVQEYRSRRRG